MELVDMTAAQIALDPMKDSHCIESWQYTFTYMYAITKLNLFTAVYW